MATVPSWHIQAKCVLATLLTAAPLIGCQDVEPIDAPEAQPDAVEQVGRQVPPPAGTYLAQGGEGLLTIRVPFNLASVPRPPGILRSGHNLEEAWTQEQRIRVAAEDLAETLNRITCGAADCGAFTVESWTGPHDDAGSILVGRPEDFGMNAASARFVPLTDMTREQHLIRTVGDGILLLGAEAVGVEAAVWDFLHHLGYRYFMPQRNWEIVPNRPDIRVSMNELLGPAPGVAPGMVARKFVPPSSARSEDPAWSLEHNIWRTRNVVRRAFEISDTHSWYAMYADINNATGWFTANPGALATGSWENGVVTQPKFCNDYTDSAGNKVTDVIYDQWFRSRMSGSNPTFTTRDAVMVEPSDGPGWSVCAPGTAGGASPSDRVLHFSNALLDRIASDPTLPPDQPTWLQFYAYSYHSQPPVQLGVGPRLFPLAANGYIRGGYTLEELLDGWYAAGADRVGIFDYWVHNGPQLPGRGGPFGTRMLSGDLRRRILRHGAMALHIDADGGWGSSILPYYVAVHVARDPSKSEPALVRDFYARAFPDASQPHVRRYFKLIDADDQEVLLSWDLVREMYATLDAARNSTSDPAVLARIEDLLIYTRHTHLYMKWRENATPGVSRVQLLDDLFSHSFRTRSRRMTAWRALYMQPWEGDRVQLEQHHASALTSAPYAGCSTATNINGMFRWCRFNHDKVWPDVEPSQAEINGWVAEGLAIPETPGAADVLHRASRPTPEPLVIPATIPTTGGAQGLGGHSRFWSVNTMNADVTGQWEDGEWLLYIDPDEGITFTDTCGGILDSQIKSARALGPVTLSLTPVNEAGRAIGREVCTASIPPDRLSRTITFSRTACSGGDCPVGPDTITPNRQCASAPVSRALDTGVEIDAPDLGLGPRFEPRASCTNDFSEPGLYRLKVKNLTAGVRVFWPPEGTVAGVPPVRAVRYDTPTISPRRRMPLQVVSNRFFYVPEGTDRVLMWHDGGADCRIHRGSSTAASFDPPNMPGFYEVPTQGHDGTVWQARQCSRAYVFDPVPPYTSAWPGDLMVPCSLIERSPADAANLGLPQDACLVGAPGDTGDLH